MARRYTAPVTRGSGPVAGPPPPQRPPAGIKLIQKPEQESVYEAVAREAEPPPLTIGEPGTAAFNGAREQSNIQLETFSTATAASLAVKPTCMFCDHTEASDLLIPGFPDGGADYMVCGACVERLVDAMRLELPRRRLRLAMERLMAGSVSIETVEAVEKMAGE